MLEPIMLSAIQTIASMRLSSHASWYEAGRWGTSDESGRLCTLCPKQVWESEYHTLIQCSAFDHIRPGFPHIFDQAQSLHEFLSQLQCALSIATFIGKVLEHQDIATHFHTYHVKCNIFWSHRSYLTSEDDNRIYLYLSLFINLCLLLKQDHNTH